MHLDAAKPVRGARSQLDVCILLDTTGSMGDEMARIKATLARGDEASPVAGARSSTCGYGAVLYRDLGDPYVTMRHPFTGDVAAFSDALQGLDANGGGDEPESLNQGMAEAVGSARLAPGCRARACSSSPTRRRTWTTRATCPTGPALLAALDQGIRIHAVAASGLDPFGTFVFRQIAQFARGKFIFIEYGSHGEERRVARRDGRR